MKVIMAREIEGCKWMPKVSFIPTNINTAPKAILRYFNFSNIFTSTKYKDRSPKIARMLDVYMMKGLVVIENIAGRESRAKMISENSIKIKARNRVVALSFLFSITKNRSL